MTNITSKRQEIINALFLKGNLSYALQKHQCDLHQLLWECQTSTTRRVAVNCARRFTKTSTSLVFCFEYCLKNPNASVVFFAPVRAEIKTIVKNIVYSHLLKDITTENQPEYIESRHEFNFKNGSTLRMFGVNSGNVDAARGHTADLVILDELAQFDEAEYALTSVVYPMTLTTRGLIIGLSTPALTTDHYFYHFCQQCKLTNSYFERTIYDNTSLTQTDIDEIAELSGGFDSVAFKREFMVQWVRDEERTIIPEWSPSHIESYIPDTFYNYYYHFVAMDFGVRDQTAILFATWDFLKQKLYVERELIISGADVTLDKISTECKRIEEDLKWERNIIRVGDNSDLIAIQTLTTSYNYPINSVKKSSLTAMVAQLRTAIKNSKVHVAPSAKTLQLCLEAGIWDKNREKFERSKAFGHCDALAAMVYLYLFCESYQNTNPIPANQGVTINQVRYGQHLPTDEQFIEHQTWRNVFKGRKQCTSIK